MDRPDRKISLHGRAYILGACFGASALVVQTELLRSVMEAAAGGVLAVSAALGAWLFWIALGALAGGVLARLGKSAGGLAFFYCLFTLPLGLGLIFLAGAPRNWLGVGTGELIPFDMLVAWSALACGPFALLVGLSFPCLARLAGQDDPLTEPLAAKTVGGLWAAEAAGALVAGILFTFILAGKTTPVVNVCIFTALPPVAAAASGILRTTRAGGFLSAATIAAVSIIILSSPRLENLFLQLRWDGLGKPGKKITEKWTPYRHLLLAGLDDQVTVYDNSSPGFSFPDQYRDAACLSLILSQAPEAQRVLVIGQSAYGPAQALLAAGVREVVCVHPDEDFERLLIGNLPDKLREPLEGGGYIYQKGDGRVFLGCAARRPAAPSGAAGHAGWDLVFLNLDGPARMNSARFYTPEFFRRARRAFSPAGGVLALRLPVGANFQYPAQLDQAASVWASLKTTFKHLELAVDMVHCHFFASNREGLLVGDLEELVERVAQFESRVPGLTRYLMPVYYNPERTNDLRKLLDSRSKELAEHTDTAPVAWFQNLRLWVRLARQARDEAKGYPGVMEWLFRSAADLKKSWLILGPALLVSVLLAFPWWRAARKGTPEQAMGQTAAISIAVAGYTGMGTTVLLIYLCQLSFGALFHQIALITALYMAALALGSYRGMGRASPDADGGQALGVLALVLSAVAVLPAAGVYFLETLREVPVFGNLTAHVVFYAMVSSAGYCSGALFPRAAALHEASSQAPGVSHTAAHLDFADHIGAFLSAVAFGVLAVPVLGIILAAVSLSVTMICPALFWFAVVAAQKTGRSGEH